MIIAIIIHTKERQTLIPSHTKRKMYCSYCQRTNHNIESCYFRKNSERNIKDKEIEPESSYAITSKSSGISQTIPTITITPSTDNKDKANNMEKNEPHIIKIVLKSKLLIY